MANSWEIALLKCVAGLGNEAHLQHIYREINNYYNLTTIQKRKTLWGGRPAYQHQVRSHLSNLCQSKDLTRISRACYSITEKGRKRIL
ncbi:winged helix-turn-helix domain-containing protein [Gemmatimonadota bacterium]